MATTEHISEQASLSRRRSRRDEEEPTDATLSGTRNDDAERRRGSDSTLPPSERQRLRKLPRSLRATLCTFEGARDFLARERTFFVWLRLSTTLMVLAGALLLRLQIRGTPKPTSEQPQVSFSIQERRVVRKILETRLAAILSNSTSPNNTLSSQSQSLSYPSATDQPRTHFPFSPNLPVPSILLGALFSILTFLALGVGLYDFLRCSRCLEQFDHFGAIQASEGFGHGPNNRSSIAGVPAAAAAPVVVVESGVPEGYDAAKAVEAHSGRVVHLTTVVIAASILMVATFFVIDEFMS
ncbi:hypothetical protein CF319_g527 [Tilletia indica]|nr:hypothetical protein CF326_g8090 [Tilletia indica]KAE8226966.1 hypothetical protein CF319_g527 [Tilletia indica]